MVRPIDHNEGVPAVDSILTYWDQFTWVVGSVWVALSGVCVLCWRYVRTTRKQADANTHALALVQKDLVDHKDSNDRAFLEIRHNCQRHHDQATEERREYRETVARIHERIDESIKQNNEGNRRTLELLTEMLGGRQ